MQSIQALRERLSVLAQSTRKLVEDNNDKWTAELGEQYDAKMAEIEDVKAQIGRVESTLGAMADDKLDGQVFNAAAAKAPASERAIFNKWLRKGDNAVSAEEWAIVRNTMSTTTSSEGGYTVPTEVASMLIDALKAFGGMRQAATVLTTAQGNPMNFPGSDGTSETGEIIAENTTATGADPSFTTVGLNVYKFSSKIVAVPFELLQDSAVDIEAFVAKRLAQRIGRSTNAYFTTGTGSSQPYGVVARASAGVTGATGQTATIIFDDLVDLIHSVDPAYREGGACRFMMRDASLAKIRKLKDDQNRPVFLPGYDGLGGAMADTILGYPVTINQDVAAMAANAKSVLFGDFSHYYIRDTMAPALFRFTDSAYTKLGQVGFLMWHRSGGNLLDTGAVKYYANSAT